MNRPQKGEGFPGQRIVVLPREVLARAGKHPLLRGLLPTDVGYFPKAARHLRARPAGVEPAIFIYCLRGRGWCDLGGNRHLVQAGDLLVIPPKLPHAYGADDKQPWTIHWAHVTGGNVASVLSELGATVERPVLPLGENPQLLALFEEMLELLEHGYTPARLLYAAQTLAHLVGVIIWQWRENFRGMPDAPQKIARSIAYMKQHLDKTLNVAALAALANLSRSHYTALFRQQTGYSPMDYFIRLRMHQACQWLDTTPCSVKEVAARLGYADQFYFSRAFRKVNRIAPTAYRLQHKG